MCDLNGKQIYPNEITTTTPAGRSATYFIDWKTVYQIHFGRFSSSLQLSFSFWPPKRFVFTNEFEINSNKYFYTFNLVGVAVFSHFICIWNQMYWIELVLVRKLNWNWINAKREHSADMLRLIKPKTFHWITPKSK